MKKSKKIVTRKLQNFQLEITAEYDGEEWTPVFRISQENLILRLACPDMGRLGKLLIEAENRLVASVGLTKEQVDAFNELNPSPAIFYIDKDGNDIEKK